MTASPQARRRAKFCGKSPFVLASSVAALICICLDTAHGALIVDSSTFEQNAANSYSGNTFVRSTTSTGTLNLNVANALPSITRSAVTMDDGTSQGGSIINLNGFDQVAASLSSPNSAIGQSSAINLNGFNLTIGNSLVGPATTFYGTFASTGGIIKDGTSTQILAGNNSILYTTVSGGDLEIGTAATAGVLLSATAVSVRNLSTFTLVNLQGGTFDSDVTNGVVGNGTLAINSANTNTIVGRLFDGAAGTLAVRQSGAGKTILTNSNSYTGATTVTAGVLQIGNAATASSIGVGGAVAIRTGGTLSLVNVFTQVGAVVTLNLFSNNVSNGVLGVGTLDINSTKIVTLSGTLTNGAAGTLALTQNGSGTTILTGADTYTGPTTVNHGALQVGDGVAAAASLASAIQVNNVSTLLIDNASLTGTVNLNNTSASLKGVQTGSNFVFGGISGTGFVVQNGTGTTTLAGLNTYTGTTTVNAGTLQIGLGVGTPGLALASKIKVNANGILAIDLATGGTFANAVSLASTDASLNAIASGTNTLSGVISGTGSLIQSGTGTTTLTAKETYTGTTTVSDGILEIGSAGTAASIVNHPVNVTNLGTLSLVNVVGNKFVTTVTNDGSGVGLLDVNSANTNTLSGIVADSTGQMALSQSGTGTTILTGSNKSYSAGTFISGGVLQIGTASTAGSIGTGGVFIALGGALTLVNIGGNALYEDVSNDLAGTGTLVVNSAKTNILYGQLTDGSAGQIALTQSGSGPTILANAFNTYSGATTVSKANLQVGTTSLPGSIGASSTTSISNGAKVTLVNLGGNILLGNVTNGVGGVGTLLSTSANTNTLTGTLTNGALGTLAVTQNGTGTTVLANAGNTYTGATTVSKGTLRIGTSALAGSIGATSAVSVSNGAILNLVNVNGGVFANNVTNGVGGVGSVSVNSPNTNTLSGLLSNGATGQLSVAQNGGGTTILTHANTYSGGTSVGNGTLLVNNATGSGTGTGTVTVNNHGTLGGSGTMSGAATVNSGGTVAPGAGSPGVAGTVLHGSTMTLNGGSTLSMQISSGSIEDALALSGALTKGTAGTFTLQITGAGVAGENYTIATFGSSTFTAANFTLDMPAGYAATLVKTATSLTLDLTSTTSFALIHSLAAPPVTFSSSFSNTTNDPNAGSGGLSSLNLTPAPAPEPGSAALLAFGAVALVGWRRRKH